MTTHQLAKSLMNLPDVDVSIDEWDSSDTLVVGMATPTMAIIHRKPCFDDLLIRDIERFIDGELGRKKPVLDYSIKPGKWPEGMGNTIHNV